MAKKKKTKDKLAAKRKQQMKKAAKNSNAPSVIIPNGKNAGFIEDIWADKGVIKVRRADGVVKSMTWKDAAYRAAQLNAAVPMLPHAETKKQYLSLVEKILPAVKQARAQLETPDKKTAGLQNLLDGKNEDGSQVKLGKFEDYLIDDYRKQYPMLEEDEIMMVLRADNKWPTVKEKETVLRTINDERLRVRQGGSDSGLAEDIVSEVSR